MFLIFTACHAGENQSWGYFSGTVVTEWLDDGCNMRLVKPFQYIDPSNEIWDAPAGSIVDGASIPKIAWPIIGGPFEGKYRKASVIHDVACVTQDRLWDQTHLAFYNAMRASGVNEILAKIMYGAVYHFGPRWPLTVHVPRSSVTEFKSHICELETQTSTYGKVVITNHGRREKSIDGTKELSRNNLNDLNLL